MVRQSRRRAGQALKRSKVRNLSPSATASRATAIVHAVHRTWRRATAVRNSLGGRRVHSSTAAVEELIMPIIAWLLGVPLSVIIVLWLVGVF